MTSLLNSAQLNLFSDEVWQGLVVPWGGQSPRALTRGYEGTILKAQAGGRMDKVVSAPGSSSAAVRKRGVSKDTPSLFPLPRRWRHG